METLLKILIETLVLLGFLWIGKSVMKAQAGLKPLIFASLAGAFASQVPFVGSFISFAVILFFMWKMARVDMVPDGVLIVIIGKGAGLLIMIYGVAIFMNYGKPKEMASLDKVPVYVDKAGKHYFAEDEQLYYLDEEGEKVFVDANEIFGISEVMEMAEAQGKHPEEEPEPPMLPEPEEVVQVEVPTPAPEVDKVPSASEDGFLKPQLSDAIVRGEPVPFQMFVPQGWQTRMADGSLDIHFDGHTFFHCSGTTTESDNNTYIRQELNRVLSEYSGFDVARQEVVTMDRKPWAKLQLTNNRGDQILLITHGSKLGCYTVELKGSFEQLNAHRAQLSRILSSFKFPPTTYYLVQAQTEE